MTKLNDADAIYYGSAAASRVYAGAALAWPAGFPMHLFTAAGAEVFDPGNPANRDVVSTGGRPVYDGPVGEIMAEATLASPSMGQTILAARPLLKRINDRDCLQFDGIDDTLWASLNLSSAFATVPKTLTGFVSVYLHTPVSGQTGFAFEGNSNNTNSRHLLTTSASGCRAGLRFGTTAIASNVIWEDAAVLGAWMDLFWELDVQQIQVAGVGTGAGTIKSWLNEEPMLSTAIVPNRAASAATATFSFFTLGGSRAAGTTPGEWCACTIGKSGFVRRALTDDERTQIKAWMRSPAYAPPITVAP